MCAVVDGTEVDTILTHCRLYRYLDFLLKVEACCRFLWLHGEVMYSRGNRVTDCHNLEGSF